jgi:hypothetical protein
MADVFTSAQLEQMKTDISTAATDLKNNDPTDAKLEERMNFGLISYGQYRWGDVKRLRGCAKLLKRNARLPALNP